MIRHTVARFWLAGLFLLPAATPLWAEELAGADTVPQNSMEHRLNLDYQGVTTDKNAGAASEYRYQEPGLGFGLEFKGHIGKKHLYIDSHYVNDRDYLAEGHFDLNGRFKLNLSSERLWHNLEHIPYDPAAPGARANASTSFGTPRVIFEDQNPNDEYGVRVEIDKAEVIAKLGNYPAHLRLKYWRLQKEGEKQLRFVEEGHDDAVIAGTCNVCHMQSKTRKIDRVTEEFSGAVDAHIGFFDVAVEQLLRTFRVKDPIPVDNFNGHSYGPIGGADFQHSEDPESQLLQSTVSVRTALSGGLVADGAYTYGKRENNSDLAAQPLGVDGVAAESVYQKVTGNLSYTPLAALTLNMRYRMLELDTENPDTIAAAYYRAPSATYPTAVTGAPLTFLTFPVRESMDIDRYEYVASAAWRPAKQLTIKGEFQRETIERSNTEETPVHFSGGSSPIDRAGLAVFPDWALPDQENIDQYRLSLTIRPLKTSALRINTWYRYVTDDEPAYGTSFDDKHEAFFGVNYNNKGRWGVTATARALQEQNENRPEAVWQALLPSGYAATPDYVYSDRDREQQNYDFGFWTSPCTHVTSGVNFGYIRSFIKQDLLFGATDDVAGDLVFTNVDAEADYLQNSQNYSAFVNVQLLKNLSTRFEGFYVRSKAKYTTNFAYPTMSLPADSTGLTDISRLDIVQQGLKAGIDWNLAERWTVGMTYGIDDYDARNNDIYDGTVQTAMVSLARTW